MEHWESLKPGGLRFVWADGLFPPGLDSFLLAAFPRLKPGLRVCDLGCGTGLLSFLLLQRQRELSVAGVDIQGPAVALARRAGEENGLADRLAFLEGDLRTAPLPAGGFDLAVCNPPYYPAGSGAAAQNAARQQARAEVDCTLEEICQTAARLLRWGGAFCLVHKPERLADLLCALRESRLEAKRLRFVVQRAGAAPTLALLEGRRGGRPGLAIEPPLILYEADGRPTAELDRAYFRQEDGV